MKDAKQEVEELLIHTPDITLADVYQEFYRLNYGESKELFAFKQEKMLLVRPTKEETEGKDQHATERNVIALEYKAPYLRKGCPPERAKTLSE